MCIARLGSILDLRLDWPTQLGFRVWHSQLSLLSNHYQYSFKEAHFLMVVMVTSRKMAHAWVVITRIRFEVTVWINYFCPRRSTFILTSLNDI